MRFLGGVSSVELRLSRRSKWRPRNAPDRHSPHYCSATDSFRGRFRDEPPTRNEYSPGTNRQPFCFSSNMERYCRSTSTVTSRLSPAFNHTLLQPTRRLGGSSALAGSAA